MTDYLKLFQAKSRHRVDQELVRRWEWDAQYYGDQRIKSQATNAKRTATQLDNACANFTHLAPEQELAFKAAASAMRRLADDLTLLSKWAKDYHAFCTSLKAQERAAALEKIAHERWGSDEQAMTSERSVIDFLKTGAGRTALGEWMHGRGVFQNVSVECFHSPFTHSATGESTTRAQTAAMLQEAMRARQRDLSFNGRHAHCSWADYEDFLAFQQEAIRRSASILLELVNRH